MGGRSAVLTVASLVAIAALGRIATPPLGTSTVTDVDRRADAGPLVVRAVVPSVRPSPAEPAGESGAPPATVPAEPQPPPGPRALEVVPGGGRTAGDGDLVRFLVEVEEGTGVDPRRFAADVEAILLDPRGWTTRDGIAMRRVDDESADLRITLAFPETVDRLCRPLDTRGTYSCWNEGRAVINLVRWLRGAATYGANLVNYRRYLINHEVGHGLGHGHVGCERPGAPAPVMLQQTIDLEGCTPHPWP